MTLEITEIQKKLLKMYVGELKGIKVIGKELNKDPRTIKPLLTSMGLKIPFPGSLWTKTRNHINKEFTHPIPLEIQEIIEGMMLGDANLRLQTKLQVNKKQPLLSEYLRLLNRAEKFRKKINEGKTITNKDISNWNRCVSKISKVNTAALRVHKSILEFQWIKTLIPLFSSFTKLKVFVKPSNTESIKWSCGFDTSSSVELFSYWKKWYSNKSGKTKKVLKKDLSLTPTVLLFWYIDDGYFSGTDLSLCTNNFKFEEQKSLIKLLSEVGIKAKIRKKGNHHQIGISLTNTNKKDFFSYIAQARLFKIANELFPFKFSNSISKKEWKNEIKEKFPEYFSEKTENRKKILLKLLK